MDFRKTTSLVSVVIPAFNAEKFIEHAIESVLSQTYPNLELIVVDDGSTDSTPDIAASFVDPRVRTVSQPNRGVATARNLGMAQSSGQLIAFLDADDRWDPEKLEKQVGAIASQPDCVAMGCMMRYESGQGKVLGVAGQNVGPPDQELIRSGRLMPFPLSSILCRRAALEKVGGFDESLDRSVPGQVEDLDLLARVAAEGTIAGVPERLGTYVIHGESASARNIESQRLGTRYVRQRLLARAQGEDLTWEDFEATYRPTWVQRYGDMVQASYRRTGELAAENRRAKALVRGTITVVLGPRYTLRRFMMQREGSQRNG